MKNKTEIRTSTLILIVTVLFVTMAIALFYRIKNEYYANLLVATDQYAGFLQAEVDYKKGILRIYEWSDLAGDKENTGRTENDFEIWTFPNPVAAGETWYSKPHKPKAFVDGYNTGMKRLNNEESQPVECGQ